MTTPAAARENPTPNRPALTLHRNVVDRDEAVTLPEGATLRTRLIGPAAAPVLLILGGISAHRNVSDADTGWWPNCAGHGKAMDLRRFRILSFDFLPGDETSEEVATVSPADQAHAARAVCAHFGVSQLHAFVGASYGGMVALAFGALFPGFAKHLIVISAAHKPYPMGAAWRSIQRKIIRLGMATGAPDQALALARELGMTTYRTHDEFTARFTDGGVEEYLSHQGQKIIGRMSPQRYLALSQSIDLHRVNPADITDPVTLIACRQDQLIPIAGVREFKTQLPRLIDAVEFDSINGHDAFLTETKLITAALKQALSTEKRHAF